MIRTNVIWNITKACPWTCSFCCVGAKYAHPEEKNYEQKIERLQNDGTELPLDLKLRILDHLDTKSLKFDMSGGDPLVIPENLDVIEQVGKRFGRENNSVTTTGYCLSRTDQRRLSQSIGLLEFTYDYPYPEDPLRPRGYNTGNLDAVIEMDTGNIETTAQAPLTTLNTDDQIIRDIYHNLSNAGIDNLLLMEYSDSGRGSHQDLGLTKGEYVGVAKKYKALKKKYPLGPKIHLQTPFLPFGEVLFRSLCITSSGLLLSNPWAYDSRGNPLDYAVLGDLKDQKLSEICGSNVFTRFVNQAKSNFYHGK
ncbi:MAG: 4Fe-4S cluster-binding domain-containing protein [Nanoarchaeota archaeon]|nr:4Fe-4S cluster-binding domain-containing protein [Nanoarchaeota archaeon]